MPTEVTICLGFRQTTGTPSAFDGSRLFYSNVLYKVLTYLLTLPLPFYKEFFCCVDVRSTYTLRAAGDNGPDEVRSLPSLG